MAFLRYPLRKKNWSREDNTRLIFGAMEKIVHSNAICCWLFQVNFHFLLQFHSHELMWFLFLFWFRFFFLFFPLISHLYHNFLCVSKTVVRSLMLRKKTFAWWFLLDAGESPNTIKMFSLLRYLSASKEPDSIVIKHSSTFCQHRYSNQNSICNFMKMESRRSGL